MNEKENNSFTLEQIWATATQQQQQQGGDAQSSSLGLEEKVEIEMLETSPGRYVKQLW